MDIDHEDLKHLLAEVGRFAAERIAGATQRPESPMRPDMLEQLTHEAIELGVLSLSPDGDGLGLWEHGDDAHAMAFNIGTLRHLGRANAGIAFSWHRTALAHELSRQLGFGQDVARPLGTAFVPTGHYGLARTSLARWIKTPQPQPDDLVLLADWFDRDVHAVPLCAMTSWQSLLWPVWRNGTVAWQLAERRVLAVESCRPQHGFDELAAFTVRHAGAAGELRLPEAETSRRLYARVLKMDMIGLLAIGAGAIARAQQMASSYAAVRRQGGKLIGEHPAVQQLLSEIEVARQQAESMLAMFACPIDETDLGVVAAARAAAHDALCHAANQAVQVHGGIGYMRDSGPEKILRDQNMLKLQAGGTREAYSFVAGWTGEQA